MKTVVTCVWCKGTGKVGQASEYDCGYCHSAPGKRPAVVVDLELFLDMQEQCERAYWCRECQGRSMTNEDLDRIRDIAAAATKEE